MYRGTTPTNVFRTDVDLENASVLFVSYKQNGKVVLEKSLEDVSIKKTLVTVNLTQKETLLFQDGIVTIQIRAKFPDNTAIASNLIRTTAEEIVKDGEI
ncbi:hypothetical protein ACMZ8M_02175 [Gardnerella pickettii]|jgi:hypothetical protein|uniref:Uncharacterized protein n=1 Tax=Gardnerella vaginalis TaxID=2702 RepID=A0AAP8IRP0_GARVA|nr:MULTISPECIES: hypothetical protein [unclassified Gardnerella]MBS4899845.1 hypothetical protein [Clostridiales bacterium]MDK7785447.1 hypothetical protein [Bifidobacterium sp. UMB6791B]MDK8248999.1 hypothetical protein [Bifidobacterium sp. UMB6794B]MDK8636039.1 hypothetical protein [Bifidobacterium sp. UMB6791A]MDU3532154.1 hypothetical protein [Alloscardovia omnicolens]PKZ59248.1 hypothetical protein CYJ61_06375 [Gardnerella vaginalis]RIY29956.1 hypothetical protein CJI49_01335 [Bifidobac